MQYVTQLKRMMALMKPFIQEGSVVDGSRGCVLLNGSMIVHNDDTVIKVDNNIFERSEESPIWIKFKNLEKVFSGKIPEAVLFDTERDEKGARSLRVRAGQYSWNLDEQVFKDAPTDLVDGFKEDIEGKCVLPFPYEEFKACVDRIHKFTAAKYESNNCLSSISLKYQGRAQEGEILTNAIYKMAGTDGSRLVTAEVACGAAVESEGFPDEILLPTVALKKILDKMAIFKPIYVVLHYVDPHKTIGQNLKITFDGCDEGFGVSAYLKTFLGQYPKYEQIAPVAEDCKYRFWVNRQMLQAALSNVLPMANPRTYKTKLMFCDKLLHIGAEDLMEKASARATVFEYANLSKKVDNVEFESLMIYLNGSFLKEALASFEDPAVSFNLNGALNPCVIKGHGDDGGIDKKNTVDHTHLLMPLQMKD